MHYRIGQAVPQDYPRRMRGEPLPESKWYVFITRPQMEQAAARWLDRNGAITTWWPTEVAWRTVGIHRRRKVRWARPIAPRYVFAEVAHRPQWDVIDEHAYPISGVVGWGGDPVPVLPAALAQMQQVPEAIREMREGYERERAAAALARMPVPGGKARVRLGGDRFVVDVASVKDGIVHWLLRGDVLNIPGTTNVENAERVDEGGELAYSSAQPRE